jgi:hypothetical protein
MPKTYRTLEEMLTVCVLAAHLQAILSINEIIAAEVAGRQ